MSSIVMKQNYDLTWTLAKQVNAPRLSEFDFKGYVKEVMEN